MDTNRMTQWFQDRNQTNVYTFAWNIQRGYTWYSSEQNDRFMSLFRDHDGIEKAVEESFVDSEDRNRLNEMVESRQHGVCYTENVFLFHENDKNCWRKITVNNCFNDTGECIEFLVNIVDFSEITDNLKRMVYRIDFDELTGIYNAEKFYREVSSRLENYPQQKFAIIQMDFDRFKIINELFGSKQGDEVLQYVGNIFRGLGKSSLIYSRLISDVFAFCMPYEERDDIVSLIQEIERKIQEYSIECRLMPSFGIYEIERRELPISIMLDHAKLACHSVKGSIINNYAFYVQELREQLVQEIEIEKDMERALLEEQFQLYLQPKYDISTGRIIGAEALCRWIHPEKGLLSPMVFVPLFERNGFIVKLDRYMWEQTCKTIRRWLDEGREVHPISLNVSRMHAYNHTFESDILELVEKYQIPSRLLELELTESAYLTDEKDMYQMMDRLKEKGLLFSVDDFGTGYSSLNMLKSIPVDIVKLDRAFLNEVTNSAKGRVIIRNMITLANELNIRVIAEGVESVEQAAFLLEMGCELAQGYYYSKPLSVSDFEQRAFWEEPVELGSQIEAVLGEKEKLLEEMQFLKGFDFQDGADINNSYLLRNHLFDRIKKYRKVLLGVSSVLYEFDLQNHQSVVYFREKGQEALLRMEDYEEYVAKTIESVEKEQADSIYQSIKRDALQNAYKNGNETMEFSYKAASVIDGSEVILRNIYILIGDEQGQLKEIFLCIQKFNDLQSFENSHSIAEL